MQWNFVKNKIHTQSRLIIRNRTFVESYYDSKFDQKKSSFLWHSNLTDPEKNVFWTIIGIMEIPIEFLIEFINLMILKLTLILILSWVSKTLLKKIISKKIFFMKIVQKSFSKIFFK